MGPIRIHKKNDKYGAGPLIGLEPVLEKEATKRLKLKECG